jgi:hypothetical protein
MSQELERQVTQKTMRAYVARRWNRDHRPMVRELKENGQYTAVLDSVSANMTQTVNELVEAGWLLPDAQDYAYTWLERRREAVNQCDSALLQLEETLTIASWTVTRLLLERCPEADEAEYLLPLDDERLLIFSTVVENEALLARLIATLTIP